MRVKLLLPRIGMIVSLLAVVGLLLVRASDPALASALSTNPKIVWATTPTPNAEQAAKRAIVKVLSVDSLLPPGSNETDIPAINMQDGWAFAAIPHKDSLSHELTSADPFYVLAHQTAEGEWVAALPGSTHWNAWVTEVPEEILPLGFRELFGNYPSSPSSVLLASHDVV